MRMQRPTRSARRVRNNILSFVGALIVTVVGFLIALPFVWIVMIQGANFHSVGFWTFLMLIGGLFGLPMFFFGFINLLIGNRPRGQSSTQDLDLARIRYTAENPRKD